MIEEDKRKFTSLGATGQSIVPFQIVEHPCSAVEAIATVGGLQTNSADPTRFVFSRSARDRQCRAGPQRSDRRAAPPVYVLNLTEPATASIWRATS